LEKNSEPFERCVFCGWPINRRTNPELLKGYFKVVKEWLEKRKAKEIAEILEGRMKDLLNNELASCRYDFFDYMREIIQNFSSELGKEFKKQFVDNFDFGGAMVT
jgi:hypothetical protein